MGPLQESEHHAFCFFFLLRSPREPEEDLYLQCDISDDAIYSNDPKCNLDIFPDSQDEDVYITPNSWKDCSVVDWSGHQ